MAIQFRKRLLNGENFEAASAFDVNNDGVMDIVCGGWWYEGPEFTVRHKMYEVEADGECRKEFACVPLDVNGDGWTDVITCSWWDQGIYWRENPGAQGGEWKLHRIGVCSNVETIRCFDIDGDGVPELFPNAPYEPQSFYKLVTDAAGRGTGKFIRHNIGLKASGHGLGFADMNGDGRVDLLFCDGWLEQPEDLWMDTWTFHPEFQLGYASVPILGYDVNGDGKMDLIAGQGHGYGLYWYERRFDNNGKRAWVAHEIETQGSQYHDMQLVDLDLDGRPELIVGTRWRAHNGNDAGEHNPIGTFYYTIRDGVFERTTLDFGDPTVASGVGIFFWVADVTGNGYPDIVAPGKEGLYLFENLGPARDE